MIEVLIADDHRILREGLKRILADTSDIVASDEASDGKEVLKKVWKNDYDLVLLDISFPDSSGLDILKQIKSVKPDLKVLILSTHPEEHFAVRALRSGASGYVTKDRAPEELVDAIRRVSQGGMYVSSSLAESLAFDVFRGSLGEKDQKKPLHEQLSDREYQVLTMIASGKTVTQAAEELSLSIKTVSTYRSRIMAKMHIKTDAELTRYAIENRLVE